MEKIAYHISMYYKKLFVIHSSIPLVRATHAISDEDLARKAKEYLDLIRSL